MTLAPSSITTVSPEIDQTTIGTGTLARVRNGHLVGVGSLILLVPNAVFALHLAVLPAVIMLLGACIMVPLLWQGRGFSMNMILAQPVALPRLACFFTLSVLLFVLGGEAHLMFANWDWLWRDSVLADLSRDPFPPTYRIAEGTFFLRAPLGMYMLPALAAKLTSLRIGHAVLLFQNAALLTLVLYLLAALAEKRGWLVILVFLSFSGLDIVGELVMWLVRGHGLGSFVLPSHIENWSGLQYSSVITQLFWVPNHALPSYWLAILVLLCAKREIGIGKVVVGLTTSLFWSPFAFIGTVPLAAYLFMRDARTTCALPSFWIASAASICFLPVALYMIIDAGQVPREFILFYPYAFAIIALFLLIEIPHFAIVREVWHELDPTLKGVLGVSMACLIVLPTVRLGVGGDLVMRGSIPSLFVLAFSFAQSLNIAWKAKRYALLGAGLAIIGVGAVTPAQEVIRAVIFPSFPISDCGIVTVWKTIWADHPTIENYLARQSSLPAWLMDSARAEPLGNQANVVCWPRIPYSPRSNISIMSNSMLLQLGGGAKKVTR